MPHSNYKKMIERMATKEKKVAKKRLKRDWAVYILRCSNDSLYTGITKDVTRRLKAHNEGKGAKYTRMHGPVELVYEEKKLTRTQALSREYAIKRLPKPTKEALVSEA